VLEPVMGGAARGVSIVELLVATAIGLVIVAAAGAIVAAQHATSRRLQAEARLMQDLRAASELVARDLRRAGHWSAAAASAVRRGDESVALNPHAALAPASAAASAVALSFSTADDDGGAVDDRDRFGFRLRAGAIELQLGSRNWQALTDPGTLVVTAFAVEPRVDEIVLATFCERPCSAGSTTCPPRQQVRSFAITVAARSPTDANVVRSLQSAVRVRNDVVVGSCEG
jgi:type IV pilus assembly protein PilW